jgi:hypothetical protein
MGDIIGLLIMPSRPAAKLGETFRNWIGLDRCQFANLRIRDCPQRNWRPPAVLVKYCHATMNPAAGCPFVTFAAMRLRRTMMRYPMNGALHLGSARYTLDFSRSGILFQPNLSCVKVNNPS